MKEGRDIVQEALQDAKSLREAAVDRAKNDLVESLAPAVRKLLDESLKTAMNEKIGGIRTLNGKVASGEQRAQSRNPADPDKEGKIEEELTLEDALQEFFPADGVQENKKMASSTSDKKHASSKTADEAKNASSKSSISEDIEISEAELRKVYEAALQTEVNVKKGFSDIVGGGELADAHKEMGIQDNPKNKHFEEETPPHKQNWIPEAKQLKNMVSRGLAENKSLRENLRKAVALVETLGKKLHEVNLFNAKVLNVNKILNSGARLTREQKNFVMESIDMARSISEVKMVFETIVGSIKTSAQMNEHRNVRFPKGNAQGARTSGTPKQNVLSESVDRANGQGSKFDRIRELAGLVK